MKSRQLLLLVFLLLVFAIKAQENLSVSTDSLSIEAAVNSSGLFSINSTVNWTASCNQSWLTIQPSSFESNPYAGEFLATGVRIHPTAGTQSFSNLSEKLTLVSTNPVTLTKPYAGNYPFLTQIQITNNTIVIGGKIMYKVMVAVTDTNNLSGTGMYNTDQNGQETNYFDPSTKTYYLSYFYNTATPRKIYEVLTPMATVTNVNIIAQENPGSSSREATITISSPGLTNKTVTVIQAGLPILSVSSNSLVVAPTLNSIVSFQLKSTTNWTVSSNQSWLNANKTSGTGSTSINLIAAPNSSSTSRMATVTVSAGGFTKTISVTQFGTVPTSVAWNQFYTGHNYTDISVVDDNVIWLCRGADSTISYTNNGGKTWITKKLPARISDNAGFCAVNETTAYITSADSIGLWKTTDGANTWSIQPTGYNKVQPTNFYGVSFPDFVHFWDVNNGITYGDDDEIYITNNGGSQWNRVSSPTLPNGFGEWSYNDQEPYRVVGDAIYILVSNQSLTTRILKSNDRGLTWSAIYPPTNTMSASFDFKDANNGLYVDNSTAPGKLYSTSDGGLNWTLINSSEILGSLKYIPNQNMYISTNRTNKYMSIEGVRYSTNNGLTWTKNPSFTNIFNSNIAFSTTGTSYITGNKYMYSTKNILNENTSLVKAEIKTPTTIDLTFNADIDFASAQDTSHYFVTFRNESDKLNYYIPIVSSQRDNLNQALVHITLQGSLPQDTITVQTINLYDTNGFPLINGSASSKQSIIYNLSGINESKVTQYQIFPNPATDIFRISGLSGTEKLTIYNLIGVQVFTQEVANNESVNISHLQSGVYLVKVCNRELKLIIRNF